ncbi:hypothetical protein M0812_12522 [Anaeramoeba flamelloides]|uniref:Uncharacterized protein n=1 Tax=Anaeramoeba flamelloides TaxID=1746091 RepID=A0AAV7ZNV8_9EUKA|nr:hypothetical protein M0812_12522 [Anaeramoeba flamelloides]
MYINESWSRSEALVNYQKMKSKELNNEEMGLVLESLADHMIKEALTNSKSLDHQNSDEDLDDSFPELSGDSANGIELSRKETKDNTTQEEEKEEQEEKERGTQQKNVIVQVSPNQSGSDAVEKHNLLDQDEVSSSKKSYLNEKINENQINESFVIKDHRFEMNDLCLIFLGKKGKRFYTIGIIFWLAGITWSYAAVIGTTLSMMLPINSITKGDKWYYLLLCGFT